MSNRGPFAITRCTAEDMKELTKLTYDCFPPEIRLLFMGCHNEDDIPKYTERAIKIMKEDPNDIWIGVKDTKTGKFIAGSNWKVYLNGNISVSGEDEIPKWLEGEELAASEKLIREMVASRAKNMPGPYIYLHICFTDAKYRRRGAGGMMIQWGCDLADQLFLPGYIEASKEGNLLYKKFGFYDLGRVSPDMPDGIIMKRDARTSPIIGGKEKMKN